jgi:small subunit ribosomal protein S18
MTKTLTKNSKVLSTKSKKPIFNKGKMPRKLANIPIILSKSKTPPVKGTIDYKNVFLLRKFITPQGKILGRRVRGLSAKQQRDMTKAIKNARIVGLLPFVHKDP